jgi:hypothetical protein
LPPIDCAPTVASELAMAATKISTTADKRSGKYVDFTTMDTF